MEIETKCRITGVDVPTHLVASHCKPWRDSSNDERLDGENGLLLTPSNRPPVRPGLIGLKDSGDLIVSPVAGPKLGRQALPSVCKLPAGGQISQA